MDLMTSLKAAFLFTKARPQATIFVNCRPSLNITTAEGRPSKRCSSKPRPESKKKIVNKCPLTPKATLATSPLRNTMKMIKAITIMLSTTLTNWAKSTLARPTGSTTSSRQTSMECQRQLEFLVLQCQAKGPQYAKRPKNKATKFLSENSEANCKINAKASRKGPLQSKTEV